MFQDAGPLWRHSNSKRLCAAQAVSAFGSRSTRTALAVIAIVLVTASPFELALLGSIEIIPAVFVGLLTGGFIDRSKKRNLLIGGLMATLPLLHPAILMLKSMPPAEQPLPGN